MRFFTLARNSALIISLAISAVAMRAAIITNDVFWKDTSGNNIYSQGGNVVKFGSTYYWYGVKYGGAPTYASNPSAGKNSDSSFVAVTCYSSTDLVNWKFENNIVTTSTAGVGNPGWFGRVGVFYNASTAKYVCVAQYFGNGGNIYLTGSTPTSNFTMVTVQYPVPGVVNDTTGDQSVFVDTDGTPYLIASSSSGRSNWYVARFNANGIGTQTATRIGGGVGREGNCMFKYNGRYYFCSSDLHGWNASVCYYISATNIMGPYGAEGVMVNSEKDFCHVTQTGLFYTVTGTSGTTVIFGGDRWSDLAGNGLGYNQWCPVTFSGSTPILNSLSKWDLNASAGTWSVAPGNNYVLNPSYDADRVIQTSVAGWTTSGTAGSFTNGNSSRGHTGNFYYTHSLSSSYNTTTHQTITGLPNGTYTLKVWYKSSGGQSTCRAFARNFGGTQLNANLNSAASSWTQQTISGISVTNGQCDVGVESIAAGGQWVRVDDWELTGGGTPPPTGNTYQAESATLAGGVTIDSNNAGFNGTGFLNFPTTGGTATFNNVDGNGGGTKSLSIRFANGGTTARTGTITVNGATSSITFNPTGAWTTWATLNVNITLNNSTTNTIQFASTGGDLGNIDQITVP
jgi:hypothetical protein